MGLSIGIISLGSKSSQMIWEEAKKIFDDAELINLKKIEISVGTKIKVLYDGEPFKKYDCLLMRGSYKYASLLYGLSEVFKEKTFIPIDPYAHILAHNKFMTHLLFSSDKNLKMPTTYFAAQISETKRFLKTLNYPIILKFPSGTHGKGVVFSESYYSANTMIDALDVFKQMVMVQDHINIKSDIRVIVAGEKIIGSMRRIANKDEIRANAHQGGKAEPYIVSPEVKMMCLRASKTIKANICAIDIIESEYGPLILEVNTSPGLQKITEVTRKNIAKEMVEYMFEETKKLKEADQKIKTKDLMSGLGVEEIGSREFEAELRVRNDKIVLPEFVYKMTSFKEEENVVFRVSKNKIEIIKED